MQNHDVHPRHRRTRVALAARVLVVLAACSVAAAVGTTTAVHFYEGTFHDSFGSAVASIGDVNGDGVPEFAVGADFSSAGTSLGGEVIVFDGDRGTELFRVAGDVAQRYLGAGIWAAGDFDGNGVPDLLVAAPGDGNVTRGPGYVIVASGVDGAELFRATGTSNAGYFGTAAAVIEDVTGDQVPDVLISEPGDFGPGIVRVHSGADGSAVAGRSIPGESDDDRIGRAIAVVGDVDGDGVDDYAVGAPAALDKRGNRFAGRVVVHSGATGRELFRKTGSVRTAGGTSHADAFGSSIANLGDQDGDGVPDFAVGAPGALGEGAVTVFSGGKKGKVVYTARGTSGTGLGRAVANAGDLDGDGRDELVATGNDLVAVYTLGPKKSARLLAEFVGASGNDVGDAADGAGDLDGDGRPELLVGSRAGGRAWALALSDLPFGPLSFPRVNLGAALVRAGGAATTKGKLALTAVGSKLTLKVVAAKLPADGAYSLHLEAAPGTGVFDQVASITATKGKATYTLVGTGAIPPELSTRTLDALGGRRVELRDASGAPVLHAVLPYLTPVPNAKLSGAFTVASGSPFPAATGRIVGAFKGKAGSSKLTISTQGIPSSELVHLWVETFAGSGEFLDTGPLLSGGLKLSTARGDALPGAVPRLIDLANLALRLRDDRGNDLLVLDPKPTFELALPDYRVTKIELGLTASFLRVRCDVRNRGTVGGGPVNLLATVRFLGTQASPIVLSTRTTVPFAAGETHSDLLLGVPTLPVAGTPNIHVHVTVDPTSVAGSYGEYLEEREGNNLTCAEFEYVNGDYEETATTNEPCSQ
mgnify:CR=1 FL=1